MKSDRIQAQFNLLNQFTLHLHPQLASQAPALPKERREGRYNQTGPRFSLLMRKMQDGAEQLLDKASMSEIV